MPPKGKGKKKGVVIDGIDTTPMTREQLQTFALRIKEENDREREQRNFFQLERDKLRTFWEITRNELEEARAKLRNKDRQIEEEREKNEAELQFYKQKVKHFQYEHQLDLTEVNSASIVALQKAQEDHKQEEEEILQDKRNWKHFAKDQEIAHAEQIKELNLKHSEQIYQAREEFLSRVKEIELKYEKKFAALKEELYTKHQMELSEIEERKGIQISELRKHHDMAFNQLKNYYNDITLNNLSVIKALKGQMETLRKQSDMLTQQNEKLKAENLASKEPLRKALIELNIFKKKLSNYNKDKIALTNALKQYQDMKFQLSELHLSNNTLEMRFENLQAEYNELHKRFVKAILEVQQKTSLKNELLSQRIDVLIDDIEYREVVIGELKHTDRTRKDSSRELLVLLNTKNNIIKDLQYELARVSKAHDDMLETYEEKLHDYGIPKEELGFSPLRFISVGQSSLARGPAGLVANKEDPPELFITSTK